jgi:RNA 3'-terminal phosphate cyclase (ATP)
MPGLSAPIPLDGAHMEGGGALVRTALTMASLTQQPVRIFNVRGNAATPGLTSEDLAIQRALALACGAETSGELGGHDLLFVPTRRPAGLSERFDAPESPTDRHANSPTVLMSVLPVLARSGVYSKVTAAGETHGNHVLSYDYFANVTLGALRRFGLYAFPELAMAGFGRGSSGEVRLEIEPSALSGVDWPTRGAMIACHATVALGDLSAAIGARGVSHLERLAHHAGLPLTVEISEVRTRTPGAYVTIWAEFERGFGGAGSMGRRGLRIEAVAQAAFDSFREWLAGETTIDSYLSDQILPTAAMAEGESLVRIARITQRFQTVAWVIKQFLPIRITVRGAEGEEGLVTIRR